MDGEANGGAIAGPVASKGLTAAQAESLVQILTKDRPIELVDEEKLALIQLFGTSFLDQAQ